MPPYRGRGRPTQTGRVARSGIRTRGGQYKKFDSQRTKEVVSEDEGSPVPSGDGESDFIDSDIEDAAPTAKPYSALLASLKPAEEAPLDRPHKRRRLSPDQDEVNDDEVIDLEEQQSSSEVQSESAEENLEANAAASDVEDAEDDSDSDEDMSDPFEAHYAKQDDEIVPAVNDAKMNTWQTERPSLSPKFNLVTNLPESTRSLSLHKKKFDGTHMKQRLKEKYLELTQISTELQSLLQPYLLNYVDILCGIRTPSNASQLRKLISIHAVNHLLKGRDKILKNNGRLAQADDNEMLECRDQGFTRPKILILTETRQMCARYSNAIVEVFSPEQQENSKRFTEAFTSPVEERDMPDDFNELFAGNNDNNFVATIKFTRKTIKFYSAFYQSDIILASPLGLKRIIENEDKRKKDHDFLSSIELVVVDQADAMQMQNFENIETVFHHTNLQPKELRDCDVNRVRNWYLDGNAKYFRQTIVLSAYLTPELNKLYNTAMNNVTGKIKLTKPAQGVIQAATGFGIKQTFFRFTLKSPADDPDARFKFFTTSVLPSLLRLPRPASGGQGVLIFIPSYFDFLRVRNFFATSTTTENISFGTINDYSEISEQRRARSHFLSGRHSILLYTQRAHHFFRLRIRGVKNVVMYGLPDNEKFYSEIAADYLSSSVEGGLVGAGECTTVSLFSKFDALKMERIVGSDRVKSMLNGVGDTFNFV